MTTITANTEDVIRLIKYTKLTAYAGKDDPALSSIVLHTVQGSLDDDPGATTLLIGTSSDGSVAGQYAIPVQGTLPAPVLVPVTDLSWLTTMLATDIRQHKDEETSVQLDFDTGAQVLKVRALADGVEGPEDRRGVCLLSSIENYPIDSTKSMLAHNPKLNGSDWVRHDLPGNYATILATACKLADADATMYPVEGSDSKIVTFLPRWRAVFPYGANKDSGDTVEYEDWALPN